MQFKIEFIEDFMDGSVFPEMQRRGTTMVVDEAMYNRIKSSAPTGVARRGVVIPPPSIHCPDCNEIVLKSEIEEHTCEEKS